MPKANLLKDILVGEVSLVPKAANKRKFLLFKSEEGLEEPTTPLTAEEVDDETSDDLSKEDPKDSETPQQPLEVEEDLSSLFTKLFNPTSEDSSMNEELLKAANEVELENEEAITEAVEKAELPEEKAETAKGILKLFKAAELTPEFIGALATLAGWKPPVVEKVVEKVVPAKSEEEQEEELKKEALENLSPEAREYVEKAMKASEEASRVAKESAEKLAKAEDEKKTQEFIQKAGIDYPNFPIKAESLGPILKSVSEAVDEEQFKEVARILKAADDAIRTREDLSELDQITETEGLDKLDNAVAELQKADPKMTREAAVLKACETDPSLYSNYLLQVGG
jgi:hypothetical protein